MLELQTSRHSPVRGLAPPVRTGIGVTFEPRDDIAMCSLSAAPGALHEMQQRMATLGVALPGGPRVTHGANIAIVGIGPGTWLAVGGKPYALATELRDLLGGLCAVTDQTDGLVLLRLRGTHVRAALAKGISVDLDDSVFRPLDAATTVVADCVVTLWRLADRPSGEAVFEIAVASSYLFSFWHWLASSAAEFDFASAPTAP